jgi:septin family protein
MIRKKKNVKKGIQFCLMVCGASGTGTFPAPYRETLLVANGFRRAFAS